MAINGLCVLMCLQASILSSVPVSADVNKLQNQVSAGNISATELTTQINHIVTILDSQVGSSSFSPYNMQTNCFNKQCMADNV